MDNEIKKLLEENLAMNKEILSMTTSIKKYVRWQKILGIIKLLIIVIPIIIAIIYIPPFITNVLGSYTDLLGLGIGGSEGGTLDIGSLINQYK